jgi:hypothetical protein
VVLTVVNLAPGGPGSLREALEDPRPRIVVFEVGGVIDLHGHSLVIRQPHVIVAGQTAPDPGIAIIRGSLTVETSDVVIQHLAVRSGNAWADDALGAHRGSQPVHDVLFDHCSATWAVDENLSVSGPADVDSVRDPEATSHDVTLRSCLIAEGLSHSVHSKGEHSKGTLIHDGVRNVTITGCLYAHNRQRNPRLKGGTTSTLTGNVIYDWGDQCIGIGARGNRELLAPAEVTLIDNVAIAGLSTTSKEMVKHVDPGGVVHLSSPADPAAIVDRVLRTVGARPAHRDPIDARIVQSVIDRNGRIIDSQDDVGGYPVRESTHRTLLVPNDANERQRWLDRLAQEVERGRPGRSRRASRPATGAGDTRTEN